MEDEKKINLTEVKGQRTKDTGYTIAVLSSLLGICLIIYGLSQLDSYFDKEEAPIYINYGINVLLSGFLVGIVISALGQIMINTGINTLINKTKAEKEGYKFE